jgi:hypothetical protein
MIFFRGSVYFGQLISAKLKKNDVYFCSITISRGTPSDISWNPRVLRNPGWETLLLLVAYKNMAESKNGRGRRRSQYTCRCECARAHIRARACMNSVLSFRARHCRYIMIMIMSMGWDGISELRPPTGLLFIPHLIWRTMVEWYRQVNTTVSSTRGILWHSYGQSSTSKAGRSWRKKWWIWLSNIFCL